MGQKKKTLTHSSLEKIEGIGPAKAKRLLSHYSYTQIKGATREELLSVPGISDRDANAIYRYFHPDDEAFLTQGGSATEKGNI
jgi:excinuclease ABC subunit C